MHYISFPGLNIEEFPLNRVAFSLFGRDIMWYGVIITCGIILAGLYAHYRGKNVEGITTDNILDYVIYLVIFGVIGARLYYVVFNWELYKDNPGDIIKIWNGGIAIYGAVIFGVLAAAIYCKVKKVNLWNMLDLAVLGLMIGQMIGRWGNFTNAEAYGISVEDWFLGMSINGELPVHPIFLYESLWNLAGFVLIHFLSKKRRFYGQNFLSYVIWYGVGRGFIEGIRGADALNFFDTGLRVSQVLGYLSALAALGVLVYKVLFSDRGDAIELLSDEAVAEQAAIEQAKKNLAEAGEAVEEPTAEEEETETKEETEETTEEA